MSRKLNFTLIINCVVLSALAFPLLLAETETERVGVEPIGHKAPSWNNELWINSNPIMLEELAGKVVLIRWWTDTCPFCSASAPALNEFHETYNERGLQLIGMYHPKPSSQKKDLSSIQKAVDRLEFQFPIAVDNDWAALYKYWLNDRPRQFTSVSFLLDKKGLIRYIHPGPEFHEGNEKGHEQCAIDYRKLKVMIEALLIEE
jgi:peroxiredoxin